MRSCSQRRPGICSQTRPRSSCHSLSGLSLQGMGQFLVLLNQSEQDRKPLSALALDCLWQTGLDAWSVSLPFHSTILLFLLLCWGPTQKTSKWHCGFKRYSDYLNYNDQVWHMSFSEVI